MQKVVGSSPIIRSRKAPLRPGLVVRASFACGIGVFCTRSSHPPVHAGTLAEVAAGGENRVRSQVRAELAAQKQKVLETM